jgi:hypothetical protein
MTIDTVRGVARLVVLGAGSWVVGVMLGVWVVRPHPFEGPRVMEFAPHHGVHVGDLFGVAVAGVLIWCIVFVSRLVE